MGTRALPTNIGGKEKKHSLMVLYSKGRFASPVACGSMKLGIAGPEQSHVGFERDSRKLQGSLKKTARLDVSRKRSSLIQFRHQGSRAETLGGGLL